MPDGFHREVDVEIRPADGIFVRHCHVQYVTKRGVSEPGELRIGYVQALRADPEPEAILGDVVDLNVRGARTMPGGSLGHGLL